MARGKKSSLDFEEPVVVQGENKVEEAVETTTEKAEKPAENNKAENKKRSVKICVF